MNVGKRIGPEVCVTVPGEGLVPELQSIMGTERLLSVQLTS